MSPLDADLLVVGGGPVGLVAAIEAALLGMRTVVVEPRRPPVDKACGEGLMPAAVDALGRLGVEVDGRELEGIAYLGAHGASAVRAFSSGPGLGVRRTALHAALSARANSLGVHLVVDRVAGLAQDGARVRLTLAGGGRWEAPWVLGCDGLRSTVRALLGIGARSDGRRFGLRRHALVRPWSPYVEVHWSPLGEAYVTPVSAGAVGVAVLSSRRAGFSALLQSFPRLRPRLDGAGWASEVRGAGPLHQHVERRSAGRVLLVGDAAGYVDALTGEGMRVGFECARAAVDAVQAADPARYERRWRQVTRGYRWLTRALLAAGASRPTRAALVPAAALLPGVFGLAVDSLAGRQRRLGVASNVPARPGCAECPGQRG